LRASLYRSLPANRSLYSLIYFIIFWFCCADNLKFYCASLLSPSMPLFSPISLWILSCKELIVLIFPSI
jgi:hypothetical protein